MVKELLTADRIQRVQSVTDWQEAIRLASAPLLADGSITHDYVELMMRNVLQNGPYIVLTDGFALPHAQGRGVVSRIALSLLQVAQPVDILGKPVQAFLVLATPDNRSHIETLAELIELIGDYDSIELLRSGTREQILELVCTRCTN